MLLIKNICLILFTIIGILFTVGYSALPIISSKINIPSPTGSSISTNTTLYINSFTTFINDVEGTYANIQYSDITNGGLFNIIFKTVMYSCVAITCLIILGLILAIFGLKFISKIIFLLALILMIIVFIVIVLIINKSSAVKDIINYFSAGQNSNINFKSGGILITLSTGLMFVNYIIYSFLA
jgi:hypothetical protein